MSDYDEQRASAKRKCYKDRSHPQKRRFIEVLPPTKVHMDGLLKRKPHSVFISSPLNKTKTRHHLVGKSGDTEVKIVLSERYVACRLRLREEDRLWREKISEDLNKMESKYNYLCKNGRSEDEWGPIKQKFIEGRDKAEAKILKNNKFFKDQNYFKILYPVGHLSDAIRRKAMFRASMLKEEREAPTKKEDDQ
ncbi:hypothetical protein G9A89_009729 [Geosiphon pyriformis]|nr:hypothetical protein G9A89_009729 [Geosiphon pyriformis]